VVEKFGPEHFIVQKATTTLIAVHLDTGSIPEAGDFARINYELLTQTTANTCRVQVALSKMQLAKAWLLAPPNQQSEGLEAAEEAETLARDACTAFEIGCSHRKSTYFALFSIALADVMMTRGNISSDVERVLQKALSISQDCSVGVVPHDRSTQERQCCLEKSGEYYVRSSAALSPSSEVLSELEKALTAYTENLRICTALYDPTDKRLLDAIERLTFVQSLMGNNE
jgi:hypothetical protein